MAQVVQPAVHTETTGEPLEPVGDAVGVDWLRSVGDVGDYGLLTVLLGGGGCDPKKRPPQPTGQRPTDDSKN